MNASRPRGATLHDVAREAGVSLATASRSLNGSSRVVNEELRQRVLAAAAKVDYTTNLSAQAVAKGSTTAVALLVSDISDPYFSSIAAGVIKSAEAAGLIVTIIVTERDPVRELHLVRALRGQRPRVIIVAGSRSADQLAQQELEHELTGFEQSGGRVVFVSQHQMPFDTVQIDNYGGARALAESLVSLGYSRFGVITGDRKLLTATERLAGFADGLAGHGITIDPAHIAESEFTRDGGYSGARELVAAGLDGVEVLFAVNDVMAIGAMSALRDCGLEPGVDIAVAGFDDIPTVRDVTPPLTTVRVPLSDVGQSALSVALRTADGPEGRAIGIATEVVLRASTPGVHQSSV